MATKFELQWPKKQALILSDSASTNIGMLVRDLLRRYAWKTVDNSFPTTPLSDVFGLLKLGLVNCIIIEDAENLPAAMVCRRLLSDKIAMLTPTLVILNENNATEAESIHELGPFEVIIKPITFGNFKASFEKILTKWGQGPHVKIRGAAHDLIQGNEKRALSVLIELSKDPDFASLAAPCLARFFRDRNDFKTAEKVLLSALELNSRHLGVMLAMVDLYLNSGLPELAVKVLASVERLYVGSLSPAFDKLQTLLMLNKTAEMIPIFDYMLRRGYATEIVNKYLPRCLLTEGFINEFDKLTKGNQAAKYRNAWSGKSQLAG